MKKNTLGVLLVAPIVISLLTFATTTILVNTMAVDIQDIVWNYGENVPFQVKDEGVLLEAERVYDETRTLSEGNELVWSISSSTPAEEGEEVCEIEQEDGGYYLYALGAGEATVVCQNEKQTVRKSFNAVIFEDGTIIINTTEVANSSAINPLRNFGEYDLSYTNLRRDGYEKVPASITLDITCLIDGEESEAYAVSAHSENISYAGNVVTFLDGGEAYITFTTTDGLGISSTYSFNIVEDGVNVRSYDDLLMATNFSSTGEIAVMQISLGSLVETYRHTKEEVGGETVSTPTNEYLSNAVRLFGHYDFGDGTFSFENELYEFDSDYSVDFIDQYNEANYGDDTSSYVSTSLKAALHVQKSIYGNGFRINMHNVAYPRNGAINTVTRKFTPDKEKDYFHGPLPYVFIGDPVSNYMAVEAYGQDNAGIYIDKDNVVIDDLRIRNADDQENRYNYTYTGTVVDIENAENVTIRNSVISDGKNVVRAFSADGLTIDNCIIQDSGEFNLYLGSNKTNGADTSKRVQYGSVDKSFSDYFDITLETEGNDGVNADAVYTELLSSASADYAGDREALIESLDGAQAGLDNTRGIVDEDGSINYDAHVRVKDTSFSSSGVYSIALDSMFNGGYLYAGYPSAIKSLVGSTQFAQYIQAPDKIGGTSYPVELTIEGDTKFYDWKDLSTIDTSTLINENISAMAKLIIQQIPSLSDYADFLDQFNLNIDDYFPIKAILLEQAEAKGMVYQEENEKGEMVNYINTSLIWYGGGLNLSSASTSGVTSTDNNFEGEVDLDMVDAYVYGKHIGESLSPLQEEQPDVYNLAMRLVSTIATAIACVTGSHDFKAIGDVLQAGETPSLYGKVPSIEELRR